MSLFTSINSIKKKISVLFLLVPWGEKKYLIICVSLIACKVGHLYCPVVFLRLSVAYPISRCLFFFLLIPSSLYTWDLVRNIDSGSVLSVEGIFSLSFYWLLCPGVFLTRESMFTQMCLCA